MRNKRNIIIGVGSAILIAGLLVIGAQGKDASHAGHGAHSKEAIPKPAPKAHHDSAKHHAELAGNIGAALKHLATVEAAVRNGYKDIALKELGKARHLLMQLRAKAKGGGGTINSVCPMMGGKFDPNKIKPKLVLAYKDGKVGFCCAMCIPKWNKLSDANKAKRLAAALAKKK